MSMELTVAIIAEAKAMHKGYVEANIPGRQLQEKDKVWGTLGHMSQLHWIVQALQMNKTFVPAPQTEIVECDNCGRTDGCMCLMVEIGSGPFRCPTCKQSTRRRI